MATLDSTALSQNHFNLLPSLLDCKSEPAGAASWLSLYCWQIVLGTWQVLRNTIFTKWMNEWVKADGTLETQGSWILVLTADRVSLPSPWVLLLGGMCVSWENWIHAGFVANLVGCSWETMNPWRTGLDQTKTPGAWERTTDPAVTPGFKQESSGMRHWGGLAG